MAIQTTWFPLAFPFHVLEKETEYASTLSGGSLGSCPSVNHHVRFCVSSGKRPLGKEVPGVGKMTLRDPSRWRAVHSNLCLVWKYIPYVWSGTER